MGERVPRLSAKEVESLLRRAGFVLVSQKGSHRKWRHDLRRAQVIVPDHGGKPLPIGTLLQILRASEIPQSEWSKG